MTTTKSLKENNRLYQGTHDLEQAISKRNAARHTIQKEMALLGNKLAIVQAMEIVNEYKFATDQGKQEFKRTVSLGMNRNDENLTVIWKMSTASLYTLKEGEKLNSKGKVVKAPAAKTDTTTPAETSKKVIKNKKLKKENKRLESRISDRDKEVKEKSASIDTLNTALITECRTVEELKATIDTLTEQLAGKDKKIDTLQKALNRQAKESHITRSISRIVTEAINAKDMNRNDLIQMVG